MLSLSWIVKYRKNATESESGPYLPERFQAQARCPLYRGSLGIWHTLSRTMGGMGVIG